MKLFPDLFSKTDSCRLLADPSGPAAERYRHYDAFLDHNHRALRILSELELLDRGEGLATLASIQRRGAELLKEVRGLVDTLCVLGGNRYQDLPQVLDAVARDIAPLLDRSRSPREGPLTLPFSALGPEHLPLAGAKAVNLALIKNRLELPAPDGFVVTAAAFDLFLLENRLLDPIESLLAAFDPDGEETWEECSRIQERIRKAPLPLTLARALKAAYLDLTAREGHGPLLAMRSSAVGEDTEASFAGQYTSVLNVDENGIESAYKTVLASKYAPRSIIYRLRYGLEDAATPMSVAGTVMIRSRTSGVLYTVDPSQPFSGHVRIDAALGLGERVVSGTASPDVFFVDRDSLGITQRPVSPEERQTGGGGPQPAVSDQTAQALARLGLLLERHFGSPQDVEWAQDEKGELFLLQTRPLGMPDSEEVHSGADLSKLELLLTAGQTASPGRVSGRAVHYTAGLTPEEAADAILISRTASPELAPFMGRVRGLITDLGGVASHLASVAREFGVPALMDTRDASALIAAGREVTLLADERKVYLGLVRELARRIPGRVGGDERGPIGKRLRELLDRISPLNLTDPGAPEFTPRGCRSLHDVIRFAHEKAMVEMFNLSEHADSSVVSQKMSTNIPLVLYFVDLGGGLAENLTTCDPIEPGHLRSRPMIALWRGLTHPGITWSGAVEFNARNFMALMAGSIGPENAAPPEVDSYALVSSDYLNLSVKFGYHYSNLDALCSDEAGVNTITLQFAGGAGTGLGRALRIEFLSGVLSRLGFQVEVRGDLLQAVLKGLDCSAMEEVLDQTGRLLGCSRLLDLAIPNRSEVDALIEDFFQGNYDFLGRSEARLPGFYASVGDWSRTDYDGQEVILQDGSGMSGTVSCAFHSTFYKMLGGRYRQFLEARRATHYYPVAVARESRCGDGRIEADILLRSGCADLAAGLAFGLRSVGNCFVLAADAKASELQLLEFINNVRHFRQRATVEVPLERWLQLQVTIAGARITGALDGKACLQFSAPEPVSGYLGLWSKGDTTACYKGPRHE